MGGVEFRVDESWKGVAGERATIYGQGEGYFGKPKEGEMVVSNSCAVAFEPGRSYLVYASEGDEGTLGTHVCTATKPLSSAGEDLRILGPASQQLTDTGGPPLPLVGGLLLAAAALSLLAVYVFGLSRGRGRR